MVTRADALAALVDDVAMARAVARIDLGAVERNCARLKARAGRGRRALRGGQGRRLRPRRRRLRRRGARRRRDPAGGGDRGRGRADRPPLPARAAADDGGADRRRSSTSALAAGSEVAVWREEFLGLVADRARAQGRPARVHVKHDSGMGRLGNRDPAAVLALARACAEEPRPRAGRRLDPLRDRRRTRLGLLRRAARALRARSPRRSRPSSRRSTVHAANSAAVFRDRRVPLRHGPLRGRRLRPRPLPGRPGRARPRAGAVAALLRRRRQALRRRRQRRLRADLEGAGRHLRRRAADRLRRRGPPRALQQRRGAGPAAAATRWSARSRWTT